MGDETGSVVGLELQPPASFLQTAVIGDGDNIGEVSCGAKCGVTVVRGVSIVVHVA